MRRLWIRRVLAAVLGGAGGLTAQTVPASGDTTLGGATVALVALSVDDLEGMTGWYAQCLGFRVVDRRDFPAAGVSVVLMQLNRFQLELVRLRGSRDRRALLPDTGNDASIRGFGKLTLAVDDVPALARLLSARGLAVRVRSGGLGPWVALRDPEGNFLTFVTRSTGSVRTAVPRR